MQNYYALSQIYIYPIKSLGGFSLKKAKVEARGLQYDRRWMLVDESGRFLSQRENAVMALLQTAIENNELVVFSKQNPTNRIAFPLNTYAAEKIKVSVWEDEFEAHLVNEKVDEWFSKTLDISCRLVYMSDKIERKVDADYALSNEDITSFSDAYPILLIGDDALSELNGRLKNPVSMNRFRPNLVFSGGFPFEEDEWKVFKINNIQFSCVKPCARCVMTTIDQNTAAKNNEPLLTLSTFRKKNNKILFGQNVIPHHFNGEISVGEQIHVLSRK